jgi:hypothetical protein
MKIEYQAADSARAIISSLGRTEDVRFSPSNRRLAIAAFNRSTIAVLDVEIAKAGGTPDVSLTGGIEISSPCLRYPHGVDFLDDETLAVASREGDVAIFKLPPACSGASELSPIQVLAAGNGSLMFTPGSLSVVRGDGGLCELLVCNNYGDTVTRHLVDRNAGGSVIKSEILLKKWLNLPDGISVSHDRRWIAISNHNSNGVLLYERSESLNEHASPDGTLRGAHFPHGLRFSADGRHIFLADAGAPFVHVYSNDGQGWHGTRTPAASIRTMDEQVFRSGRENPQEGGPKGIDIDKSMTVLATTSEHQPLLFLDVSALLATVPPASPVLEVEFDLGVLEVAAQHRMRARNAAAMAEARAAAAEQRAARFKAKAARAKTKAARAKARAGFVINGRPWRITAPFSRLYYALKRPN